MAVTQNTYTGNSSTTNYSFTFPYLETTDIKVSLNGVDTTAYTLANATTISFNTAPANGAAIRIYRDTDDSTLAATFYPGSAIRATDLNDNFTQNLYSTQEVKARYLDRQSGEMDAAYVPTISTDVVTKGYMETNYGVIDEVGFTRWRQVATSGQTVFSGADSYGNNLSFVPNREQVYLNGALQQINADYTTNTAGTAITFGVALTIGDIVDVVCINNLVQNSTTSSDDLSFVQSGTGAVTRSIGSKLRDVVSVKDFGAVGDGVTDDTAAIQAALSAAASITPKGVVEIANGHYKVTSKLTAQFGVDLLCKGQIDCYSTQMLEYNGGDVDSTSIVRNLKVRYYVAPPNTGVGFCIFGNAVRADRQRLHLDTIDITSSDGLTRSFGADTYIRLNNSFFSVVNNVYIDGCFLATAAAAPGGLVDQKQQTAVKLEGVSTETMISNTYVTAVYAGVVATGTYVEGFRVTSSDFVGVYHGIYADTYNRPGVWISSVHINCVKQGVYVGGTNIVNVSITNLWLYRSSAFWTDTDWTGIYLKGCSARTEISGISTSLSITADTQYGIKLENCSGFTVSDTHLSQVNNAIYHVGNVTYGTYSGIIFNGLGASGVGFRTSSTDSYLHLGPHQFLGTVGTRYSVTTQHIAIRIDRPRSKYQKPVLGQTVSGGGTALYNVLSSNQVNGINFAAGAGAYTYYIDFDKTNAMPGDQFVLTLNLPTSTNPTVVLRNGSGGTTLATLNSSGTSKQIDIEVVCDYATEWWILRQSTR